MATPKILQCLCQRGGGGDDRDAEDGGAEDGGDENGGGNRVRNESGEV